MSKPNVTVTLASNGDAEDVQCFVVGAGRKAINVRLAQNEDGDDVHGLLYASGLRLEGLDWSDIYPHWLVVGPNGKLVGCLQVLLGKPVGFIEFMATEESLGHRDRAGVVQALYDQGYASLKTYGAQMIAGMIPFEIKAWKRVVKRRGGVVLYSGSTFITRLV